MSFNVPLAPGLSTFDGSEHGAIAWIITLKSHLLNITYVYDLSHLARFFRWALEEPGAPRATAKPSDALNRVEHFLNGWEFSGITIYSSGTPFTALNGGSPNGISSLDNAGVAAVTGPGSYPDLATINTVSCGTGGIGAPPGFSLIGRIQGNPCMFTAPVGLTYGNAGRNDLNNPGRLNFDVTLSKSFKFAESRSLQLRMETFNTFNHTQFEVYDLNHAGQTGNNVITCYTTSGSACVASNGIVTSFLYPIEAHRSRTLQFGAKFLF